MNIASFTRPGGRLQEDCTPGKSLHDRLFEATVVGLAVGLADLLILQLDLGSSRGSVLYLPPATWFSVPLTWIALCALLAFVFSVGPLRKLWIAALTFAGPGLLLLSRAGVVIYRRYASSAFVIAAGWLVITGIAALITSWLIRFRYGTRGERVRKSVSWAVMVVLVVSTVAIWRLPMRSGGKTHSASPGPNIVLIFLDTVRRDDAVQMMPHLQAFAARSIVFDNAWAPASWTLPSHLAVLTGEDPWHLQFDRRSGAFAFSAPTLADRLAAAGYRTGAIYANPVLNPSSGLTRGFSSVEYTDRFGLARSGIGLLLSRSHFYGGPRIPGFAWLSADDVTRHAIQFVRGGNRPYFLTLNFMDAHYPYYVDPRCRTASFQSYTESDRMQFMRGVWGGFDLSSPASSAAASRFHAQYREAMSCLDRSLGSFLDSLQHEPDFQRTVVVIVADHGEQFGEHKFTQHGNSLYRQVLQVPLVLRLPGAAPTRIGDPVSITDVDSTLMQVAGLRSAGPSSLTILDPEKRRPVMSEQNVGKDIVAFSIVTGDDHFVLWANGAHALFDYKADPEESQEKGSSRNALTLQSVLQREWQRSAKIDIEFRSIGYFQ